jgi:DNA processing protein
MSIPTRDLLIALSLLPFLNPNRTRLICREFDPIDEVTLAGAALLETLLGITRKQAELVRRPPIDAIAPYRERTITLLDDAYPDLLLEIHDPPLALHYRGDISLLARPAVAIVGSRRASPYAINAARELGRKIVAAGLAIVSGLARGVDTAAHEIALDSGGATVGVLGTGIDGVYPKSNRALFERIEERGLIVSEFPPGTPPLKSNFPMRNRVISGLTLGTVIVEATSRSGSLITARTAAEQGREVYAVPGSIFSAGSEGTHRLIQYGAKLVHDADDIFHELRDEYRAPRMAEPPPPAEPLRSVLEAFSRDEGSHVEAVARTLGKPPSIIAEHLLRLEMGGWIRALPGSRYVRVK